jgi:hypothetical protein
VIFLFLKHGKLIPNEVDNMLIFGKKQGGQHSECCTILKQFDSDVLSSHCAREQGLRNSCITIKTNSIS